MSATKYAAGRDYGFWLDINGQLQVFGSTWTYNLPQIPTIPVGTHVRLDGSTGTGITGPDIAALAGARTFTVEVDCSLDVWTPTGGQHVVNQWGGGPGLNSWYFLIDPSGLLRMTTPALGDLATPIYYATVPSPTFTDGTRHVVGGTWAADNGTNSTMQFKIDGASKGSLLTGTQVPAGLFDSSHPIRIGGATGGGRMVGNVYGLKIYADGNLVASPDFTTMAAGQTTITDAQGNVWTLGGAARVVVVPGVPGGGPYLHNKAVITLEEPEVGGVRPAAGGFMLGEQGQLIGIGDYDPDYWTSFPLEEGDPAPVPPVIRIPNTVTGHIDVAASSQMGAWALDASGTPQLLYISPLATNYATILTQTFPRPKPAGGGFISIAAGSKDIYLLDAAGQITSFGYGTAPVPIYPAAVDGIYKHVVASPVHAAGLSDQGKVLWWPNDPADTTTITNIQTPPPGKHFLSVGLGPGYSYTLVELTAENAAGQVRGYGVPLGATNGSHVVLALSGHTGISQGPRSGVWGFAVVAETLNSPFGITPFGVNAPVIPPNPNAPNPPEAFRVFNYDGSPTKNIVYLRWEKSLGGPPAQFYEIAMTPVVGGAAPIEPPAGSFIKTVRDDGANIQQTGYPIQNDFHGHAYYMIRSIGAGGAIAGGASAWSVISYDNTLITGDWRKIVLSCIDTDCDEGGFVIMLDIDSVYIGDDGWTGAQIQYDMVPAGVYYAEAGKTLSVARNNGPIIGNSKVTTDIDVNGLSNIVVPPDPDRYATAVVDYEICIEDDYKYWVHDATKPISSGRENYISVTQLLDTCRSEIAQPHYLRCLVTPDSHTTSNFCLGPLDQLDYDVRSGVFSVLGRPAPVVVVDSRSTAKGHLIFMSHGPESEARAELHDLREVFRMGHPLMLQTEKAYELANGQLYFQPTAISDRWIGDDARRPEHALEVDFIEIDPPRGRSIVRNIGVPWASPKGATLEEPPGYMNYADHKNPLFGLKYCDGGVKERFLSCDDMLNKLNGERRSCNEVFHTPDSGDCP